MLLSRKGYRVLLVDKSRFPSGTVSTHVLWQAGLARAKRWGLLEGIAGLGAPPIRRMLFDTGECAFSGSPPPLDGIDYAIAPRRFLLDKLLLDAAANAGAEVREGVYVSGIVTESGRVTGIRGPGVVEKARLVVGADGMAAFLREAEPVEPLAGMRELPGFFRQPWGDGWALAGDAGYHKHPLSAQGITDAFRDADFLSEAIDDGFSGRREFAEALAGYEQRRNEAVMPMYESTCSRALLQPFPPAMMALFRALQYDQREADCFFGTDAGTVPIAEFFAPENLERIIRSAPSAAGGTA